MRRRDDAAAESRTLQVDIDVAQVAELWRRGSVVGSWLLDLTAGALRENPELGEFPRPRLGFRRRPLDAAGRDRRRRAGAGDQRGALLALRIARQCRIRRPAAVGDALRVRRPCREAEACHMAEQTSRRDRLLRRHRRSRLQADLPGALRPGARRGPERPDHRRRQGGLDAGSTEGARARDSLQDHGGADATGECSG